MYLLYSRAIKGGGAILKSTSSGGASTQTSSSGGGTTATSSNGGGFSVTSASGGGETATSSNFIEAHIMSGVPENDLGGDNYGFHVHEVVVPGHSHTVTIASHTHSVSVSDHTHNVTVPGHTHSVSIPSHTHNVDIPDHTHEIEWGIYTLDRLPTAVTIKVDGNTVPYTKISAEHLDLIPYLTKEVEDRVKRGWHTVEITPNDLGRITAQVTTQFFIQSRGGGNH
jgi:hypothetical protein